TPEEDSTIAEVAKGVLEALLTKMGLTASIVPQAKPVMRKRGFPGQ
ncbi:unnamed protein product, partial [marine sediment metagenome]